MTDEPINVIEEIIKVLSENNKTPADVISVGTRDGVYGRKWDDFVSVFSDETYDHSLAEDFIVGGLGWWLEIDTNDEFGTSWWVYREPPVPFSNNALPFNVLGRCMDAYPLKDFIELGKLERYWDQERRDFVEYLTGRGYLDTLDEDE